MDRTEYGDALGRGQQAGSPSLRFEGRAMEIGIAAIALPAAYWEDKIDTRGVRHAREAQAIGPTCGPAFRHLGGRTTRGTVGPEHPDLERVRVVHAETLTHRSSTNHHLIVSGVTETEIRAQPYTTLKDVGHQMGARRIVVPGLVDRHRLPMI